MALLRGVFRDFKIEFSEFRCQARIIGNNPLNVSEDVVAKNALTRIENEAGIRDVLSEDALSGLLNLWVTHIRKNGAFAMPLYKSYVESGGNEQLLSPGNRNMSALAGLKQPNPNGIIRAVLSGNLDLEENTLYQSLANYGADKPFWVMVAQASGYQSPDAPDLKELITHILFTAASRTMRGEVLSGLEKFISTPHQTWCYDFITDWLHSGEDGTLYRITRDLEHEFHLGARFSKFEISELLGTECFPCVNECILSAMMADILNDTIQPQAITAIVERRRAMIWYDYASCYYDGLVQVANMMDFHQNHAAAFHTVDAEEVWKAYTQDYWRMDTWYRNFHLQFQKSLISANRKISNMLFALNFYQQEAVGDNRSACNYSVFFRDAR